MSTHPEKPILFSGPMVRAILDGRKTQTRRVVVQSNSTVLGYTGRDLWSRLRGWDRARVDGPPDPIGGAEGYQYLHVPALHPEDSEENDVVYRVRPRIVPGVRLWVKETFSRCSCEACAAAWPKPGLHRVTYVVDDARWCKRPAIHMPRWASRLTLVVDSVRVERLQDISEEDAVAEGWPEANTPVKCCDKPCMYSGATKGSVAEVLKDDAPVLWFADLWESINGSGSWAANPWVWVYSFKPEVRK